MAKETIEKTVEEVDYKTLEEEITFCDGCTDETDEYVELTNISTGCLENLIEETAEHEVEVKNVDHGIQSEGTITTTETVNVDKLRRLTREAEAFHFCPSCQSGVRSHGEIVALAVEGHEPETEPSLEDESTTTPRWVWGARLVAFIMLFVPAMYSPAVMDAPFFSAVMVTLLALFLMPTFNQHIMSAIGGFIKIVFGDPQ